MSEKNFASAGDMETLVTEIASKLSEKIEKKPRNWSTKTWNGLTTFAGSNIWTDGDNIYYSAGSNQYILDKTTSTWLTKTWSGLNPYVQCIWTDGDNIYYSNGSEQYVLDKSTSTWSQKTWNGLTDFYGMYIWTDGDNIYYSYDESGFDRHEYVLDKSTSTWSQKTWYGLEYEIEPGMSMSVPLLGDKIWTDGDNIYYSDGSTHFVLDKSTSTWSAKTWIGLTSFSPYFIWTDGDNIYYSNGSEQYVLDKSTSTWLTKTWIGLTSFYGPSVWNDGNNIYYSYQDTNYVLDKSPLLRADGSKDYTEYATTSELVNYQKDTHFDQTVTLSTSTTTTITFSDSAITTSSLIDIAVSEWGLAPEDVTVASGVCTVVMPKVDTARSVTVRIYVR